MMVVSRPREPLWHDDTHRSHRSRRCCSAQSLPKHTVSLSELDRFLALEQDGQDGQIVRHFILLPHDFPSLGGYPLQNKVFNRTLRAVRSNVTLSCFGKTR